MYNKHMKIDRILKIYEKVNVCMKYMYIYIDGQWTLGNRIWTPIWTENIQVTGQ